MKKYFIIAAAAIVALAACSKSEIDQSSMKARVINFNTVANKATKAETFYGPLSGTTYTYTANDFGVFAWYLASGDWNTSAANSSAKDYMGTGSPLGTPVKVSFNDTKDIWVPSSTYYWPLQGKLTFIAYAPYSAATATFSNAGVLTLTGFEVNTNVAQQYDLLYSSIAADKTANEAYYVDETPTGTDNDKNSETKGDGDKGVTIKFKHALAQVIFKAKTAADVYTAGLSFKVNSITVNAAKTATSMTVTNPLDAQAAADITTWTIPATPTKDNFLVNTVAFPNATVAAADANFLTNDFTTGAIGDPLLMIPLKDTAADAGDAFDATDPTMTIVYTLYRRSDAQPLGQKTVTVHFKDVDDVVKEWLAGKKYVYELTIDLEKIYFNPTVTDWVDGEIQDVDVPKDGTPAA